MAQHRQSTTKNMIYMAFQVLEARLTHRGTESSESLVTRLHHASDEMEYGNTEVKTRTIWPLITLVIVD